MEIYRREYIGLPGKNSPVDLERHHIVRNFSAVDGSFVTAKSIPNDFDGCWSTEGVDFDLLNLIDPILLTFGNGRAAQKAKYLGELFPADTTEFGTGRTFLEFFQIDKETGDQKGIIAIDLRRL